MLFLFNINCLNRVNPQLNKAKHYFAMYLN